MPSDQSRCGRYDRAPEVGGSLDDIATLDYCRVLILRLAVEEKEKTQGANGRPRTSDSES